MNDGKTNIPNLLELLILEQHPALEQVFIIGIYSCADVALGTHPTSRRHIDDLTD